MRDNYPETLVIGSWSSYCGSCGKDCSPSEETHESVLGYNEADRAKPGCGVRWTKVASEYVGLGMEQRIQKMRPDLELVPSLVVDGVFNLDRSSNA